MQHLSRFQTTQGHRLKAVIDIITPLVQEATLYVREWGLKIQGKTETKCGELNVVYRMPPCSSDSLVVTKEHETGLDLKILGLYLRPVTLGDVIAIESDNKNVLFRHWNETNSNEYPIRGLLPTPEAHRDLSYDMDFRYVTVNAAVLHKILKSHSHLGKTVFISVPRPGLLVVNTDKGLAISSMPAEIDCKWENEAYGRSSFDLGLIRGITKAYSVSQSLRLGFHTDGSLQFSYAVGSKARLDFDVKCGTDNPPDLPDRAIVSCTVCRGEVDPTQTFVPDANDPTLIKHKDCRNVKRLKSI